MKEYKEALLFWDNFFKEEKAEKLENASLGCKKIEDKLRELTLSKHVLDFGCGSGWASIYMAQVGVTNIVGMDQSANAVRVANDTAKENNLSEKVNFICADGAYLNEIEDNTFDGFFSCNTLDVIPTDVTKMILEQVKRICSYDAKIIISINPFLSEALKERTKMEQIDEQSYCKDGILRCVNKTKEEWSSLFENYFSFEDFEEYKFDSEPEGYMRRMFILKNNKK